MVSNEVPSLAKSIRGCLCVTAGSLPPGMTLATGGTFSGSPTATGVYNFTVTVTDQSGCIGSTAYTLTIDCPINGATLSPFPSLCDGDAPISLTQGSPSGGTYSGTGVSGSSFDPASGTQTITYSLTDVYGCPQSTTGVVTVNPLPTVTLSTLADACSNDADIVLSGGTPAGGVYSGTGVTAGSFNPSAGTQNITYTYTDGNNCSDVAIQTIIVNTSPTVTLSSFTDLCEGSAVLDLTGGSPAGGTYSGTNVSAGQFDPSTIGTTTITYDYTDVNACSGSANSDINVIDCLGLEEGLSISGFSVYPNPTKSMIHIQFVMREVSNIKLSIYSADGKIIFKDFLNNFSGHYQNDVDLAQFEKGIYILELETGFGKTNQRIILE